jgi:penicillin-binding protein 1A
MPDEPPLTIGSPEVRRQRRRRWPLFVGAAALLVVVGLLGTATVLSVWTSDVPPIPGRDALWQMRRTPGIRFLDHDGAFIAARGAKYGALVGLGDLPPYVPKAFLAAEDRRFYSHGAVDALAILRATKRDLFLGRAAEGASTISQQLARTLFLTSEHSLRRKVQEAVLASRLEGLLGKDGVLQLYLNRVYLGAGAYGLDAAAHTYFGKSAAALTLAEAAVLAALPNAPTRLAPTVNMTGAWARARRVLQTMRREGWVSAEAASDAETAPPALAAASRGEGDWSYVLDQAASQAVNLAGPDASDLVARLTVDSNLQAAGLAAVRAGVLGSGKGRDVSQGAMVVLARDGAIRVMVGGLDHRASAFNRVTQAKRQPGSAFKAFVFGAALEAGDKPTDTRVDAPISQGDWTPENYGGHFLGPVSLAKALALSINSVAVRLTLEVGPAQVAAFARRLGVLDIPLSPGPSIALGAYEVTPLELASAYQVFQNGGATTTSYLVEAVSDSSGHALYTHVGGPSSQVLDPLYASRMVRMLEGVVNGGTGAAAAIGRPAAGKTGTSQKWRDAWFVGFTPDLLAAVWVGNDNGRPMRKVTGGEIPAVIWKRFMTSAERNKPVVDFDWLQPEPPEASSEEKAADMNDFAAPIDEPPGDADDRSAVSPPDGGGPLSLPVIDPDEDGRERALDQESTGAMAPTPESDAPHPLPTTPSPF